MEIFIAGNYETMSKHAAAEGKKLIQYEKVPLLCTASGDTPVGLYEQLVRLINEDKMDICELNFVGLDEWVDMNGSDEGSCRFYLDEQLFNPLQIGKNKISFFDGRAKDL